MVTTLLAACATSERAIAPASPDVLVAVRSGAITAPDSASSGWMRVRVEETEGEHIVVVFRLPATSTTADVSAFVASLDTAPATPLPGIAVGGPEVGAQGDVIVHLTPGLYVLACVRRGDDEHRHAVRGESRVLHVRAAEVAGTPADSAPASAGNVQMVDFAYTGPDQWIPGAQLLRIENTGKQDHQVRLARLRDGASMQSWMTADDPDSMAVAVAGMARVGPGETAYLPVDLTPGNYFMYCLIADGVTHRPHVELGMLREIHVR